MPGRCSGTGDEYDRLCRCCVSHHSPSSLAAAARLRANRAVSDKPPMRAGTWTRRVAPSLPTTSWRTPGEGGTTSAPYPGQGLDYHVNAPLHSDVLISPLPAGRGESRRHRVRGNYPDKLSGYMK
jgi:hypothetical protein